MIKYFFSDLDETLLVDHHVPEINRQAIEKARKKGVKFIPATGRGYQLTEDVLKEVGIYQQPNEYEIAFNGGMIVECKDYKVLRCKGLDFETVKTICDHGVKHDVCIGIFTQDWVYFINPTEMEIERKKQQKANFKIIEYSELESLKNENLIKVFFSNTNVPYLKEIAKTMKSFTDGRLEVTYSSSRYLEFNTLGVSKGEAIEWLCQYLGGTIDECLAIGDNDNDLSMIEKAGIGVAVKSATEKLKVLADEVTTLDYMEGAVAEMLEKYVLID